MTVEAGVLLWVQSHLRMAWLDPFVCAWTHLGDRGVLFLLLGVGLLAAPRTRPVGVRVLLALLLGGLCTNLALKPLVARPRPWLRVEGLSALVWEGDPCSFPSGHTTAAFAFAGAVLWSGGGARWQKAVSLLLAVLMGASRLYVGVHYPTDVLAGLLVGLGAGRLSCWLWQRVESDRKSSS